MKAARLGQAVLGVAVALPLLAACGGGSKLPEAPPCVEPTPPTAVRGLDIAYVRAVQTGVRELDSLTTDFRLDWPNSRFSSAPEFRQGFVNYAAESKCLANALITLPPGPAPSSQQLHRDLEPLLRDHIAVLDDGLRAVQKRNVSDYRRFHDRIDETQRALDHASFTGRTRR